MARVGVPSSCCLEGVRKLSQEGHPSWAGKMLRSLSGGRGEKGILSVHRAQGCETVCARGWESSVRGRLTCRAYRGGLPPRSPVFLTLQPPPPLAVLQKSPS